ncbi:MAG: TonB-dependent receptor, partial [Bacteroidetes bacterium]|nr:TonB-dependent receptor [Bacteroidota bacterium]
MQRWGGEANVNFLAGSFTIEGPIKKDKTAMMLSFRHSMFNAVLNVFRKDFDNDFYDVHFRLTHLLDRNNKLMVNFYTGQDQLGLQVNNNNLNNRQRWGNHVASVGWTHLLGSNSFVSTSLNTSNYYNLAGYIYTIYDDSTGAPVSRRTFNTYSSIAQYTAKTQVEVRASNTIKLNFGGEAAYTRIKPFESKLDSTINIDPSSFQSFNPLPFREFTLYAEGEFNIGKRILFRPGMHFSAYQFRSFPYNSYQPRFFAAYRLKEGQQIFASYNRMIQYLHLLTNTSLGINSDTWVPATGVLSPEASYTLDLGYSLKTAKKFSFTAGAYWKKMNNVTNYAEGKSFFINTDSSWEQNVETGKGWSYGLELMAEKASKRLNLHIAYTLSWNWRQFAQINQGRQFPFKYDRRHNLNIALTYKADKTKDISMLWTIASGDVFTLPERIYPDYDNAQQTYSPDDVLRAYRFIYHFSGVNDYRTNPYHRLDLAANFHPVRKEKHVGYNLSVGVYNVYGSPSQYSYGLEGTLHGKSIVIVMQNKLFNITPYVSTTVVF